MNKFETAEWANWTYQQGALIWTVLFFNKHKDQFFFQKDQLITIRIIFGF